MAARHPDDAGIHPLIACALGRTISALELPAQRRSAAWSIQTPAMQQKNTTSALQ
jgi:hypothetical protein